MRDGKPEQNGSEQNGAGNLTYKEKVIRQHAGLD